MTGATLRDIVPDHYRVAMGIEMLCRPWNWADMQRVLIVAKASSDSRTSPINAVPTLLQSKSGHSRDVAFVICRMPNHSNKVGVACRNVYIPKCLPLNPRKALAILRFSTRFQYIHDATSHVRGHKLGKSGACHGLSVSIRSIVGHCSKLARDAVLFPCGLRVYKCVRRSPFDVL